MGPLIARWATKDVEKPIGFGNPKRALRVRVVGLE
jgi:hypothetical protein